MVHALFLLIRDDKSSVLEGNNVQIYVMYIMKAMVNLQNKNTVIHWVFSVRETVYRRQNLFFLPLHFIHISILTRKFNK